MEKEPIFEAFAGKFLLQFWASLSSTIEVAKTANLEFLEGLSAVGEKGNGEDGKQEHVNGDWLFGIGVNPFPNARDISISKSFFSSRKWGGGGRRCWFLTIR